MQDQDWDIYLRLARMHGAVIFNIYEEPDGRRWHKVWLGRATADFDAKFSIPKPIYRIICRVKEDYHS